MERFKNILLVINSEINNPVALSCAFSLAKNNNAQLKLVDIVKEVTSYQPMLPDSAKYLNLHDILVTEKRDNIDRLLKPHEHKEVDTSIKILTGIPFLEITREVIRRKHDLVIVTPEGRSEFKDMLFGTTTMHLMRKCPCPVWVIKPASDVRFRKILAAVNIEKGEREASNLNRKILEMSTSLAKMHDSELHIAHVWDFPIRSVMIPKPSTDEMTEQVRLQSKSWLEGLLKNSGPDLSDVQIHLIKGEAGSKIPRLAKEVNADLIVMGTLSRTGIPGLFIGNTAEKILYRVNCSVLAVKPEGFISPVQVSE